MRYSYEVAAGGLACAAAVQAISIALHLWRSRRAGARHFCPGPRTPLLAYLFPLRWFIRPTCGYDLTGLRPAENGSITCPECARRLASLAQARAKRPRVLWARMAIVLIALISTALFAPIFRDGTWADHIPNWLVVTHRVVLGKHGSRALNAQAQDRFSNAKFSANQQSWMIPSYIDDLRDDNIRWNADYAIGWLERVGLPAVPKLEAALDSGDYQQRQFAAHILRHISEQKHPAPYIPSDKLLAITAEGLRDDTIPSQPPQSSRDREWHYSGMCNAREGVDFLCRFPDRTGPLLLAAMRSGDAQAAALAAGIACLSGRTDLLPQAAPVLIPHLRANSLSEDAKFAGSALLKCGPAVLPYLQPCLDSPDAQTRKTAQLIAWDLLMEDGEGSQTRRSLQVISDAYADPIRLGAAGPGFSELLPEWAELALPAKSPSEH